MDHDLEILNDAGYYQYSKSVRTTIEGAFRKAMEIADLEGFEGTLNALTAAVGRYLQLEASKGRLSAAEVGFVIGLAKPETTKFIKMSNYGRTVEELPVDSKGCLVKPKPIEVKLCHACDKPIPEDGFDFCDDCIPF